MRYRGALAVGVCLLASGCSEATGKSDAGGGASEAVPLTVEVPATGRVFVRLATPEVVTPADEGMSSMDWDLAFEGYDVFTNSGLSGPGDGGAFPLDMANYESGEVPDVPFLIQDEAGGAFIDWYAYNPSEHVIYSRFHVYGVQAGARLWKVQLYSFYGEVEGAPVSALYSLQVAEVTQGGPGPATQVSGLDATAGGSEAPETEPSACLDLETNEQRMLLPAEAAASTDWDLCFRRATVMVNGELGGPGEVGAVDLNAAETDSESLEEVMGRTQASEAARFNKVGYAELTDPAVSYRGDHVVTAFSERWVEAGSSPPAPAQVGWLIEGPDGATRYLAAFDRFEGATEASPGAVTMQIKKVQ